MLFCVAAAVADIKFGVVPNTKRGVVPNTKTSVVPNTKTSVFPNNKPGDVIDTKPGVIPVLQRTEVRDEVGQYSLRSVILRNKSLWKIFRESTNF